MFNTNQNLLLYFILKTICIILVLSIHEFTRAVTSTLLGDTLPKQKGRLTLNPIKHIDPIGLILMLATNGFGWGKQVETTQLYYKNRKRDSLLTAIIPCIANLVLAYISLLLFKLLKVDFFINMEIVYIILSYLLSTFAILNINFFVYNLVPIPPMDGIKILAHIIPANKYFKYLQYEKVFQAIFLLLLFTEVVSFVLSPICNMIFRILSLLSGL